MTLATMMAASVWIAGCASHAPSAANASSAPAVSTALSASAAACSGLAGKAIPASAIGLPTTGATVSSATLVGANDAGNANGEFCKVTGAIHPVDPSAPHIQFELNLPTTWNGKALQRGGGGYNGTVVTALDQVPFGPMSGPTPLAQGYATFGSDSGHQSPSNVDGKFALNEEALDNFGGSQIKKTHDVAVYLIDARYGSAPKRMYFAGNSQGGHEAFLAIQRWPADYDGAIATHPVYDFTILQLDGNALSKKVYAHQGAGWLNPNKVALLQREVLAACDGLDGVEDGVISNVAACRKTFKIAALRCEGGKDTGDTCLSDAQIAAVKAIDSRVTFGFPLANGVRSFARWPILEGGDWSSIFTFGKRAEPSSPPTPMTDFGLYVLSDPAVRYFITRDTNIDSLTFDPNQWKARTQHISKVIDANDVDLSAFASHGGKLLLMHGSVDTAVSPYNTIDYYERLVARVGKRKADAFMRFYIVPGFGHGTGTYIASWDSLGALDQWVEHGVAPKDLVVADAGANAHGRTRPLCEYPSWPKYTGSGDVNVASNFKCATH
ncbi:tannase/feruloyl esterase family alpha/beta hydrolase [Pararobbsia silviterrae]|uniref:Tannase/feruloyl esterase family alpha/beta hydrolase n=2 Tax=Pararobbsia silviterrae TaxID=1792498 RepID=A0A494X5Z7_9BURK|nr:tannase/feruloyl esterase family alpha/beta hydrolase [Pararobbsia silviterrae]